MGVQLNIAIPTARDLLHTLQSMPDHMLDRPIACRTPDDCGRIFFGATEVKIIDYGDQVNWGHVICIC